MTSPATPVLRIVIAGASGFVGMDLIRRLSHQCQVIALTRSESASEKLPDHKEPGVHWIRCNLFSLRQTEHALLDADAAYFLVHSMMPAARLTQGSYKDLDLIIADNFSRAAAAANIKRIIYLGGVQPAGGFISEHLMSRLEVEKTLASRTPNTVALRAGLVLGPGGSSSLILVRLVKRLPVLVCPPWTSKLSSPIALRDTVSALVESLHFEKIPAGVYDLHGPELISYRDLMIRMADEMNKNRFFLKIPYFSTRLSRLWVSVITGHSRALVAPLIESLLVDMLPGKSAPLFPHNGPTMPLIAALHQAELPRMRLEIAGGSVAPVIQHHAEDTVVSIQRLPLPEGWSAIDITREYTRWLPNVMRPFLRVETSADGEFVRFMLIGLKSPLLELQFIEGRSDSQRTLLLVVGGLLRAKSSSPLSRLEFRVFPDQGIALAAVLDFTPALPWLIYLPTQAQIHRLIMYLFGKKLAKISKNLS